MNKWLLIGGASAFGIMLVVVVALSIRLGKLRQEVRDGEALVAAITKQRDDAVGRADKAMARAAAAGKRALELRAEVTEAAKDREAAEAALAKSRELHTERRASVEPRSLPECMRGLRATNQHVSLLEVSLATVAKELRLTRELLAARETQVVELEAALVDMRTALTLEGDRVEAVVYTEKQKKKKRIIGFTLGALVIAGAGVAGGVAIGKSG